MLEENSHKLAVLCEAAFLEVTRELNMEEKKNLRIGALAAADRFVLECWYYENYGKEAGMGDLEGVVRATREGEKM